MSKNSRCIHSIKKNNYEKTTFVILCAKKSQNRGCGNIALKSIGNDIALIDVQIETIKKSYENNEIILVSGFEHDELINYIQNKKYKNIRILENRTHKVSDILDGWRMALNIVLECDTYIIHGDRYFSESCIQKSKNTHLLIHNNDKSNYDLGISYKDDNFINMSYGLPDIWSEIFFISKKDISAAKNIINDHKKRKIYTLESYINKLSEKMKILVVKEETKSIIPLKDL